MTLDSGIDSGMTRSEHRRHRTAIGLALYTYGSLPHSGSATVTASALAALQAPFQARRRQAHDQAARLTRTPGTVTRLPTSIYMIWIRFRSRSRELLPTPQSDRRSLPLPLPWRLRVTVRVRRVRRRRRQPPP